MTRASDRYLPSTPAAPTGRPSDRYLPTSPVIGPDTPYGGTNAALTTARLYQQAVKKWQAGETLTSEEARALADMQASNKTLSMVGVALQPFQVLSDVTKGAIGELKGNGGSLGRGAAAAAGHVSYGLAEYLPGMTGARARGVTGAELLKGTKYEGNESMALAVEVLADPSVLLTGAGVIAKGASTLGRLAQVEKLAGTAEGAAMVREALKLANTRGDALLRAGDEITGVPAVVRKAAGSAPAQALRGKLARVADTQLPGNNPISNAIRREGGGTWGDALATPDVKAAIYTPEQLARDEFRTGVRLDVEDYGKGLKGAAQVDAQIVADLTRGLSKNDAAEANRLLGVFTTTTKPEVAAEALRKLTALGGRVKRDLEPAFVAAVKATDRVGQNTMGSALRAEGLPAVIDPAVNKAIQDAEKGADLVKLTGKYTTAEGRPRAILMTQYVGRDDVPTVIKKLTEGTPTPAKVTVDPPQVARTLEAGADDLPELPPLPIEPVGVAPRGAPPVNTRSLLSRIEDAPVTPTPAAARQSPTSPTLPASESRSPAQVLQDLFGEKLDASPAVVGDMLNPVPAPSLRTEPSPQVLPAPDAPRSPAQLIGEALGTPPALTPTVRVGDAGLDTSLPPVQALPDSAPSVAPQGTPPTLRLETDTPPPARVLETQAETPTAPEAVQTPPAPRTPAAVLQDLFQPQTAPVMAKTPGELLQELIRPGTDPYVALPSPALVRTPQDVARDVALPVAPTERTVTRAVPTTYRTVEVDANALDWGSLPDNATRRAVLNSIPGAGNARFERDATGALRIDRPNLTIPLGHPTISHYFPDEEVLAAGRTGTEIGERTITRQEQVPDWYNPREGTSVEYQRGLRDQALKEADDAAFPNDLPTSLARQELRDDDRWVVGDAYVSYEKQVKPGNLDTRAAANSYAARVRALTGTPPTQAEVFQYRLALARYRRAANLRNIEPKDVAKHIHDFYQASPEATLYEGVLSTARTFNLGTEGVKHLQGLLRTAESGFERQMSTLERLEFAQYLVGRDLTRRGGSGGLLVERLKRRPETVSQEFEQVFAQDVNALKLLDDQVRTRTAAIVRQQTFRKYRDQLEQSGQLLTQKKLAELRAIPEHRLTPEQRDLRLKAATALTRPGAPSGWKVLDRNVPGFFQKGDVIPWWAYFDLFGATGVDDVAVSAAILNRGGLNVYDRLWSTQNAMMLGSPSSIVNDQVGQLLQMGLWGVTPDAVIEGLVRRATATPQQLDAMRASGIQSATLEANIGANREALTRLAARLDGDTDLTRTQRVVDAILRFRERGTGIDPTAMTGAAGLAADVAHMGSGYLFRLRSNMSDLQRESLYFHRIALGDAPKEAARYANDVLMDMRLVPAYARVVRRYWPFFNWIAMSGPRSIVTILRKPGLNAAWQRLPAGSDTDKDGKDSVRRLLARDGGYINLGADERGGARLYVDPRNWDPTNTIPQLLDWSGTKVGAVGLPWYANLVTTVQWGFDRFGRNIYADILDGSNGGFTEAYKANPKAALKVAAQAFQQQFNPSFAPGSPRAQAFVRSVLATADLPDDGSKDITLAKTLATTPQGRAYLSLLQNGSFVLIDRDLSGVRDSPYTDAAPSMARAAVNYLVPIRAVNPDQNVQGTALQQVMTEKLRFQEWLSGERKKLQQLEAGGASEERIRTEEERIDREAEQRGAKLDVLDALTR